MENLWCGFNAECKLQQQQRVGVLQRVVILILWLLYGIGCTKVRFLAYPLSFRHQSFVSWVLWSVIEPVYWIKKSKDKTIVLKTLKRGSHVVKKHACCCGSKRRMKGVTCCLCQWG